tara:strand:- start:648 stop:1601 length:954 start_codon:yes stop_codon:yes gene_type:complete
LREFRVLINDQHNNSRLDIILSSALPDLSRSQIQQLIKDGHAKVDDTTEKKAKYRPKQGQVVTLQVPPATPIEPIAQPITINTVWEDDDLMIIDKPAGMTVHPGAGNQDGTLLNGLLNINPNAKFLPRAGIVHRLDKDTSGLMVVAKSDRAYHALIALIKQRDINRVYHALVWGHTPPVFKVEQPIGRHTTRRTLMSIQPQGKPALTHFKTIEYIGPFTLLECKLETGRTHQIRVHCLHSRHPIVADPTYHCRVKLPFNPDEEVQNKIRTIDRQFLHAHQLSFIHPVTSRPVEFFSKYPAMLSEAIQFLRSNYQDNK